MLVLIEVSFQKCYGQKLYSLCRKSFWRFFYLLFFVKWFFLIYENLTSQVQSFKDFIKRIFLFVNIKSVQVGDDNDLQHVGILMRLSKSKLSSRFSKFVFSVDKLKSPNKKKSAYEELNMFNESFISFMKESSFCEGGLSFPSSNHFLFEMLISNTIISDPSLKSYEFINLPGIPSFM